MAATYTVALMSKSAALDDAYDKTTASAVYQIFASEPTTLAHAQANASAPTLTDGVPLKGTNLPDATGLPCVKRSWKFGDDTKMFILATLEYDSTRTVVENPLAMAVKVSSSGEQHDETYYEDKTSGTPKLARHTNNLPFDELPIRSTSVRVFEIEKNVPDSTTDASVASLENMVNSAPMTIGGRACAAKTVFVSSVSLSETKTLNGASYKTLKSTVRYNPATWTQKYESLGLVDIDGKPKADAAGNPVEKPYPLTSAGAFASSASAKGFEIALEPYAAASLAALT